MILSVEGFIFSIGLIGISSIPNFRNNLRPTILVVRKMSFDWFICPSRTLIKIATGGSTPVVGIKISFLVHSGSVDRAEAVAMYVSPSDKSKAISD
jgi:hypothetical protein